jgi:hypothetical protein
MICCLLVIVVGVFFCWAPGFYFVAGEGVKAEFAAFVKGFVLPETVN